MLRTLPRSYCSSCQFQPAFQCHASVYTVPKATGIQQHSHHLCQCFFPHSASVSAVHGPAPEQRPLPRTAERRHEQPQQLLPRLPRRRVQPIALPQRRRPLLRHRLLQALGPHLLPRRPRLPCHQPALPRADLPPRRHRPAPPQRLHRALPPDPRRRRGWRAVRLRLLRHRLQQRRLPLGPHHPSLRRRHPQLPRRRHQDPPVLRRRLATRAEGLQGRRRAEPASAGADAAA
mmetsp:Transcript_31195/g.83708  ORF Transcript_31195/g.83708 Transcript_31195/m.83708 type:complete len:232 (+) Transcript_31195:345-1040(+)